MALLTRLLTRARPLGPDLLQGLGAGLVVAAVGLWLPLVGLALAGVLLILAVEAKT